MGNGAGAAGNIVVIDDSSTAEKPTPYGPLRTERDLLGHPFSSIIDQTRFKMDGLVRDLQTAIGLSQMPLEKVSSLTGDLARLKNEADAQLRGFEPLAMQFAAIAAEMNSG